MTHDEIWNCGTPVRELLDIDVPAWISQDISPYDIIAIYQGGCESGAYMPAVTYSTANATMAEHGDDVLQYIEDYTGELPQPESDLSWSGIACHFLAYAVELWASDMMARLEDLEPEEC